MSNPPKSLNALFDSGCVCEALGSPLATRARPARARCPICRHGIMDVFETLEGGGWFHCRKCGQNGDMVELVQRVRNLSARAAIVWLSLTFPGRMIRPAEIERHLETHVAIRQRTAKLWHSAADNLTCRRWWGSSVLERCSFPAAVPFERLLAGPGGVMGIADATDVERCFSPTVMIDQDRLGHRTNLSGHAVFRGRGWRDVLVIPYYDLPWRISGFKVVGRVGDPQHDDIFKVVARGFRGNQHMRVIQEAGLALHPGVPEAAKRYDRTLVALDDAVLAAGLQMRNFEYSTIPLPVIAWHDSLDNPTARPQSPRIRTSGAWAMVSHFELVFWMPQFRFAALLQAMARGARIATIGSERDSSQSLREFLRWQEPRVFIRRVLHEARPWYEVLGEHLASIPGTEVEQLYRRLTVEGLDPEWVFSQCAGAGGARLAAARAKISSRTAQFDRGMILERDGAWFFKQGSGPEILLSNAIVRLDSLTNVKRSGQTFVRGRILRESGDIPFFEPLDRLEKHADRWLQAQVHEHSGGEIRCDRRLARRLFDVAVRFQEPKFETSHERLGWDPEKYQFVLPGYVTPSYGQPTSINNVPFLGAAPRRVPDLPRILLPTDIEAVADDCYVNRLFWAASAALIANVLAPQWHHDSLGVALVGAGAQTVGREVAAAMCCASVAVRTPRDVRVCWEEEGAHDWPLFVERAGRLPRASREEFWRGESDGPRNLIVSTDWGESRALLLRSGWIVVEGSEPAQLTDCQRKFAELLLPAYLHDLHHGEQLILEGRRLRRRLRCPPQSLWIDMVMRDLGQFGARIAQCGLNVTGTARRCIVGPDMARALAELLGRGLDRGDLKLVKPPAPRDPRRLMLIQESADRIYLSDQVLAVLLQRTGVPAQAKAIMSAALQHRNVGIEVRRDGLVVSPKLLFSRQTSPWLVRWGFTAA